jgi:hypothetical protein
MATYVDMFVSAVGTAFASTAAQREVFARFVLDGLQWMMVYSPGKNIYDPSVVGRAISRKVGLVASLDTNSLTNLTAGWYASHTPDRTHRTPHMRDRTHRTPHTRD